MNNRLSIKPAALALAAFLLAPPLGAADLKIAVLDTQRALVATEEARDRLEKAQSELQAGETELNDLGEAILDLQQQFEIDGGVMSPSEQRRVRKELEDKQLDFQYQRNKLQKELNDKQQELLQVMAPKLNAVLEDLIALEGYDLIMERANLRYVNPKHDITRRVTEKLNEKREKTEKTEKTDDSESQESAP